MQARAARGNENRVATGNGVEMLPAIGTNSE